MLYCSVCKKRFSERKGTVLFGSRLPEEKVVDALGHLFEQNGIRQTARLVGVNKNTVNRLARIAGKHAESAYAELVAFSPEYAGCANGREMVICFQKRSSL
ncbi:hypothetical protein LJC47_05210 [Desulfosarcina sp. OttesenSCG-928-B08]|nr:hypothetical protein [Desulfosarcina sp. OttesenSCG-928-B08]